ncbi:MAG TPA: hypothetical protein P5250_03030 [Bacteroidales bacterium]|nr:hypothetical protein [Bacteroidales bacterium]
MNKNIIIFVMFLSNIILLNAQTLKFSQIKLIDNNISTVPQNKVWKIESVLSSDPLIPSKGTTDNTYYTIK